jgi:uncharacterized phage infection (PIP) family protein YhgE
MFGIGGIIKAVALLATVIILAAGGWYVMNLKADLAISESNNEKLKDGIKEQQDLMDRMQNDIKQIQETNKELQDLANKQKADVDALSKKFSQDSKGNARDFGALAAEKPELVERLINRGTKNAMRCLEIASGAPRTEQEINAKTSSDINKECPAIANPNYRPGVQQ